MSLLKEVNHSGIEYSYIHYFQGADIPIKTQDAIHRFFEANDGLEFVMVEKNRGSMAVNKTHYLHLFCHNRFFRKNKIMKCLNFGLVYIQKILHFGVNTDVISYQGSALFSITSKCSEYLEKMEPEIRKRFRFSLAADEVFIQTMLMKSQFKNHIAGVSQEQTSNARLIDRTRPDGKNSPHIWRLPELDFILAQPDDICFARKFDENIDFEIVQRLEKILKQA
jgi:hypothetical protein